MSNTRLFNSLVRIVLLLLILSGSVAISTRSFAQEIRTLITTPEEREYLDYLRQQFLELSESRDFNILEDGVPLIPEDDISDEDEGEIIRYHLSGIVRQSDGTRVVWLNGQYLEEDDLPANIQLTEVSGVPALSIIANGNTYLLKSGQTLDVGQGSIREAYQSRGQE